MGESDIPTAAGEGVERIPFPGMTLSSYTTTRHFGGVADSPLPNYLAFTTHLDANNMSNPIFRLLCNRLEDGALPACVVDFSFVLEGLNKEELPERALGTIRVCHLDPSQVSLPLPDPPILKEVTTSDKRDFASFQISSEVGKKLDYSTAGTAGSVSCALGAVYDLATDKTEEIVASRQNMAAKKVTAESLEESKRAFDSVRRNVTLNSPKSATASSPRVPCLQNEVDVEGDIQRKFPGTSVLTVQKLADQIQHSCQNEEVFEDSSLLQHREELKALVEILSEIVVPGGRSCIASIRGSENRLFNEKYSTVDIPVLNNLHAYDLLRYLIASEYNLKGAAVSLVESAAWRGITFPVDTRACRVELESGQFFQQGVDLKGNPVLYFRVMCVGPWRMDVDAQVLSVLYRLESAVLDWSRKSPRVQFTLVLLMGNPFLGINEPDKKLTKGKGKEKGRTAKRGSRKSAVAGGDDIKDTETTSGVDDNSSAVASFHSRYTLGKSRANRSFLIRGCNPRIDPEEEYRVHGNDELADRLRNIVMRHYPERLHKCLVLPGDPLGEKLVAKWFNYHLPYSPIRGKITILDSPQDLKLFILADELVTFAGGNSLVNSSAFVV